MNERVIVTGAAGFIGSHLTDRLLDDGFRVTGIDCFTDYYDPARKRAHLSEASRRANFTLIEEDLNRADLASIFEGAAVVFHLAAQAGVRRSWGSEFNHYVDCNVLATQKVLEALRKAPGAKLVYSSSSSVYGETRDLPMREDHRLRPVSPYGATKLSGEDLCELYRHNFGIDYAALRYFTVYGPRQRPDMAFSRFILSALGGGSIEVYGDGRQTRDFTFVSDAVEANILASRYRGGESVFNIGGGSRASVLDVLGVIERRTGGRLDVKFTARASGDVTDTWADTSRAAAELGFSPSTGLEDGLAREIEWYREYLDSVQGR